MQQPVTIACVWVGEKYSPAYPAILQDMVRRNLPPTWAPRFVCITDRFDELPDGMVGILPEPHLPGWWQKVAMFKPGKLPDGRTLYLDLDVAITGELGGLADRPGIIQDWHLPTYNSSVMVWDSGDHPEIWEGFVPDVMRRLHGDQDWITECSGWEILPAEWCISYRSHAQIWPQANSKVVVFHGEPKPHEISEGWVPRLWRIGGLTALPKVDRVNVPHEKLLEHIHAACKRPLGWFHPQPAHERECCIVGGGPSAGDCIDDISSRVAAGAALISLNGSLRWLLERGLVPTSHVILDARPENAEFALDVPEATTVLVASQCHPAVFRALASHKRTLLWHAGLRGDELEEIIKLYIEDNERALIVGGGSTVGLRAMFIAHQAGYRKLHLYGFDSCYLGDEHHGYRQPLNDADHRIRVQMAGQEYECAVWMARQANEFNGQYAVLTREGCEIYAHGRGLIPDICRILNSRAAVDGLRDVGGVWWPADDRVGCIHIPLEVGKVAQIVPLCRGHAVAVQAGANVGLVPRELARHFGRVIAFEPDQTNLRAARLNINGANVELHLAALGEIARTTGLCGFSDNCGAYQTNAKGSIPVRTIDSLELPACDLIMLDVEGDEITALNGAVKTIEKFRPVVVCEDKGLSQRHGMPEGSLAWWMKEMFGYRQHSKLGHDVVLVP